jgi:hypothetical protein
MDLKINQLITSRERKRIMVIIVLLFSPAMPIGKPRN